MANLAIIEAKRYIDGDTKDCVYIGTIQDDTYVYFNDDIFWRCKVDKSNPQLFYLEKQIWTKTNNIEITNISLFNARQAQNGINGAGATAPNADVETAVKWAIQRAADADITYSNYNRNLKNPNGYSYDCSSFVITAFYVGGFDAAATYTGDMRAGFLALGFTWIPGSYFASGDLIRGDIQVNENAGNAGHTNIYIGNNQDVDCGSTPAKVIQHTPNNFGNGWHGVLRYEG